MIIPRFKYFSDRVCIEIIKLVELYDNQNGQNISHWVDMTGTFIGNVLKDEKKIFINEYKVNPQLSFIKAIDSKTTITKTLGNDFIKYISNTGKPYIENLWNYILTAKSRDEKKYTNSIKINGGFLVSPEDYILLFKYIALCFSDQMNYEVDNIWSDINTVQKLRVNYLINYKHNSKDKFNKLIANCIFQFKRNVLDSGNNILNFYNRKIL